VAIAQVQSPKYRETKSFNMQFNPEPARGSLEIPPQLNAQSFAFLFVMFAIDCHCSHQKQRAI
jgi:hypothetical protein